MTGIEVNSEANFPNITHAGNITTTEGNKTHYWSMMTVTICFAIPLIEMETELV